MIVSIKRIDKELPLPEYKTAGSVCFDLVARVATTIQPQQLGLIPSNIIVKTPPGYMFIVVPRSSTPKKKGLLIPHGIGVLDQDYCGPNDEVQFQVLNYTQKPVVVEKGERLAQGCFIPVAIAEWKEVDSMKENASRGGFGSTG